MTRTQFYEAATPGVKFEVEGSLMWITWRGQSKFVPLDETSGEGVDASAPKAAKAPKAPAPS